jgi:HSP20 family protein
MAKSKPFDPLDDLKKLADQMEQDFFELVTGRIKAPAALSAKWKPPLDIYELEDHIIIKLELAGMKKKDISIIQEGNRIRISGRRKIEGREQVLTYHQMEINYGEFERVIVVSDAVKVGEVEASYKDGFLIIRAQKKSAQVTVEVAER